MNPGKNEKEAMRNKIKSQRKSLNRNEILGKSRKIQVKIEKLPEFKKSETVSFYVAKKEAGEVETRGIIKSSLDKGKKVSIPLVVEDNLELSLIRDLDQELNSGAFGVQEPKSGYIRPLPISNVELIAVPGLAFDLDGNRLGYGKGYYDRLLDSELPKTLIIGLGFEFQIKEKVPHTKEDVPVHKIITENRIISI